MTAFPIPSGLTPAFLRPTLRLMSGASPDCQAPVPWSRRDFLKTAGMAALGEALPGLAATASRPDAADLFPTALPGKDWVRFRAAGFAQPVCGVIYRLQDPVTNGMALGGVDTGCLDLESNGMLGYCTIFNSHVPRRGPIGLPLLGLAMGGRAWVLCQPPSSRGAEPDPPLDHVAAWLPEDLGQDQPAWKSRAAHVPGWFKSLGGSRYDLPPGKVCCHTPAVVRWTSPITGEIQIRGGLWLGRNLKRNQRWELARNAIGFTSGTLEWGPNSRAPLAFAKGSGGEASLRLRVEEGDVLELSLGEPGVVGDFVGVDLTVSATGGNKSWDLAVGWSDTKNPSGTWSYGYTWDMPNIMRGDADTGERTYGNDYYQDMMLWSLPAALEARDFSAPTQAGGLVDRILRAAKEG